MQAKIARLRKQIIDKVERCNYISMLQKLLKLIETDHKISEPAATYKTDFDLEKELEKGLQSIKDGKIHSNEEVLKIIKSW